jgi:hypothetical protein
MDAQKYTNKNSGVNGDHVGSIPVLTTRLTVTQPAVTQKKVFCKYSLGSIFSTNLRMAKVQRSIFHDQIYEQQQLNA